VFSHAILENLINDILDLAKLENCQFTLNESVFDLNKTVVRVLDMVSLQAFDKGVELRATVDDP
jgi:signal transduction histidine kinase